MVDHELRVMVLVKAAPVLTSSLDETMCVAAMTLDDDPRWVRLHPVPFRDMADESRFRKYQELTARVFKPKADRRPESWTPIEGSMAPGPLVGTEHGWARRRERLAALGEVNMCDLVAANRTGSGPSTPSLGVVRPVGTPELLITRRDDDQLAKWTSRAEAIAARPSLFDDPLQRKPAFEVVPWRFRYRYRCASSSCGSHSQTIVDWEVVALWRNVRHRPNWQELMRKKFVDELWADRNDTVLFVGNQEQHPHSFLVLGIFWPPRGGVQQSLLG